MNIQEQKVDELKVHGFTIIENVLNDAEIQEMKESLIAWQKKISTESTHRGTASHVSNLVTLDSTFFKCIDHPKVLPYVETIMGKDLILGSLNSRIVRPGDQRQGLHADIPKQLLRIGQAPVMMNTVWALSDYTKECGATYVVPGTHNSGLTEPPEGFKIQHEVQACCPAGSVIIFNGQLWHGGGENSTKDQNRYALFGHYRVGSWLRFQCDPHYRFDKKNVDFLTQRQKELLRMSNGLGRPHGADGYQVY